MLVLEIPRAHHHLVAQVGAEGAEALEHADDFIEFRVGQLPGQRGGQFRVAPDALEEGVAGVGQLLTDVGQGGDDHGVLGQQRRQAGIETQRDVRHRLEQLPARVGHLPQQSLVLVRLQAPAHFPGQRRRADAGVGGDLVAGEQLAGLAAVVHPDLALEDGDTGPLGAAGDAEHRALDGNLAVGGVHEQVVARCLAGGADDDGAVPQPDRRAVGSAVDGQFRAFVHFQPAAVGQAQNGAGAPGGADRLPGRDRHARRDGLDPAVLDDEQAPVHPVHHRGGLGAGGERVQIEHQRDGQGQEQDGRGGQSPARREGHGAAGRRCGGGCGGLPDRFAAGDAVANVVLEERPPRGRQAPVAIGGDQVAEAGAVADAGVAGGCGRRGGGLRQMLADPRGGGGEFGRVRQVRLHGVDHVVEIRFASVHGCSPCQICMWVWRRRRARRRVTATTPHEMPSIRPISLLVYPST